MFETKKGDEPPENAVRRLRGDDMSDNQQSDIGSGKWIRVNVQQNGRVRITVGEQNISITADDALGLAKMLKIQAHEARRLKLISDQINLLRKN